MRIQLFSARFLVPSWTLALPILAFTLLTSTVLTSTVAHSQDSAAETGDQRAIRDPIDSENPIEVVVTAGRGLEQNPIDVPQSLSTVTREDLEDNAYADIDDALRRLPGFSMAPAEGNPNYWQEGFTLRGLGAQHVLTLTDGVRQAGQGIGYGGGNLSLYSTFNTERIEVVRGPASVLYGTDAFGGAINIITREPERRSEFGTNQGARYVYDGESSSNRYGTYVDIGDQDISSILTADWTYSGRPNLPDDEEATNGDYRNFGLAGKFDYHIDNDSKFRFLGNLDRTMDVTVEDSTITLPIATFPPPGSTKPINSPLYFAFPLYQRSMIGTEYETSNLGSGWENVKSGVYWQQLRRQFHRETAFYNLGFPGFGGPPSFVNPEATVTNSIVDTNDRTNTIEWQNQARFRANAENLITFGFDLGYDETHLPETELTQVVGRAGIGESIEQTSDYIDRVRAEANQYRYGLYAQNQWTATEDVTVTPGVRADYFTVHDDQTGEDESDYGFSGSIGTVYKIEAEQSVYLNVAAGYRAPDLGERFQNAIVNLGAPTRIIGKADLDSEHSVSIELGTKDQNGRFTYDAAVYTNWVDDYITTQSLGLVRGEFVEQYQNSGSVYLYGAELATNYAVTDAWDLHANTSRTYSPDTDIVDLANWAFNYGTSYAIPVHNDWVDVVQPSIEARSVVRSIQETSRPGRTEFNAGSFTTVDVLMNLSLSKALVGESNSGKLIGGIRNILDRNYQEPFFPQTQPGINAYVGLQLDF